MDHFDAGDTKGIRKEENMTSIEKAANELVAELRKRKEYLEKIRTLAQKQQAALEKADVEEVSGILEARGRSMLEVDALDASGVKTSELLQTAADCPAGDGCSEALVISKEIENLIKDIQSMDSRNMEAARGLCDDLRKSVQEVSRHRKSRELYKGEGKGISGAFVNKRR